MILKTRMALQIIGTPEMARTLGILNIQRSPGHPQILNAPGF